MKNGPPVLDDIPLPALLRAARGTYGPTIHAALAQAGCDDVPRNGIFVIASLARTDAPLGRIVTWLGVSKQAAGQLVDTLVLRGYLERAVDPDDRRKLTVALTERGRAAAAASGAAVERIEAELVARVGAEHVAHTRVALAALAAIGEEAAVSRAA